MEFPPAWASYTVAWLATVALILLSHQLRRRKLNLAPGRIPWPIIRILNLVGPLPHRSLHYLSQKYGPIVQLKFASFPVIIASSVEMAKAILKTYDVLFVGRPKLAAGKDTTYNYSNISWSPYGPYWRQARKICLKELFSTKRLESCEYIRVEELNSLLRNISMCDGRPINVKDRLSDATLNVISRMVLGKKYIVKTVGQNEIVSPEEFKEMIDELFLLNGVLDIGDSIPWLAFLDLQGYIKRMKVLSKKFDRFLEHVLDEHNARREEVRDYVAKDMVDVLLQLADDPNLEVKLERHGVKAFTLDMIATGTQTSAETMEWTISELLKNPKEELDRVIGRERWVQEKDIVNLPFINAIVKETMRLHPVVPLLAPRMAREDVKLAGHDIAKGICVFVNVWTIGRDPSIWENPNEFFPERFIGKAVDVNDFELLPFGAGRRMCPGYSLGVKVVQADGFNWCLPDDMKKEDLNMEEMFGLPTPKKFPLAAAADLRLPINLYSSL